MITGKQLKRLAQMRVIEMASSGKTKQFNRAYCFGYQKALEDAGARWTVLQDVLSEANWWASENCPATMQHTTCQAGCELCLNISLPMDLIENVNQ